MHLPQLTDIPGLKTAKEVSLADYTRFGLGGPAALLVDAHDEESFRSAILRIRDSGVPVEVIGAGSNLIVSDSGFPGVIVRYAADFLSREGSRVFAGAGAALQDVVDFTIDCGLSGMHTMTGIPGWLGAAVYGNAGAYGRSIDLNVSSVRFFDGSGFRQITNEECRFRYRESIFKSQKTWIVMAAELELLPADADELRRISTDIRKIRDAKYPPSMKCAGSIFKNVIF